MRRALWLSITCLSAGLLPAQTTQDIVTGRVFDRQSNHLSAWSDKLEYLGEYRAKRDSVRIRNFPDGDSGSPAPLKTAPRATHAV